MRDYTDSTAMLREKALSRMPNVPREPSEYLVAVSSHQKSPETCQPADFMWFKCRPKHTIAKIRTFYTQKTSCQVHLFYGASMPADTVQISWIDQSDEKLIVFQAVEDKTQAVLNAAVQQPTRPPLRPVNSPISPKSVGKSEKLANPSSNSDLTYVSLSKNSSPAVPDVGNFGVLQPHGSSMLQRSSILNNRLRVGVHGATATSPQELAYPLIKRETASFGKPWLNSIKHEHKPSCNGNYSSPYPSISGGDPSAAAPVGPIPNSALNNRLKKILGEASPEILEVEVQDSLLLLDQFKIPLSGLATQTPEAHQWLQQIETLKMTNTNEPTIIGVVGNTGAGKSSVINAMLDEERLVPTNCMRACTAVVTELSWNSSNDENARYRADIEFIKPEDWAKELRILFEELLDGNGHVSREASKEDSEAGIAYAKIKAVYPKMTKEDIARSNIADLMREPVVQNVLGTTKTVEEARSDRFYRTLQSFVDSKEKTSNDNKKSKEIEFWPLIKVVKIYTKADALSTGAVVVDLPGVHDSNAARSAIAQNYMKMCTGLWIVAPITRAVDDKAAKSLLGESFKRQLKYDGTYSRVTFICSKTDDISITEASDGLGLEDEMSSKWAKVDQIERDQKRLESDLGQLKESKAIFGEIMSDTDDQLELWDKLRDDLEDGKTVYLPANGSKKRKSGRPHNQRKKRTIKLSSDDDDDDDDTFGDDMSGEDELEADVPSQGEPLTLNIIEAKIAELKSTKKEARVQRRELDAQILTLREELKALDASHAEIEAEMSAICIAGRNKYSKGAIQQDFAAGIKELDQENQVEADEANFNPDEDVRDYAEVARSLPVFCVSSRAYQKLSGRLQRDKGVPGFNAVEETEIPQLQAHCKKLTEAGRASTCRRFLNAFSQLVNSLSLWASNDGSGINLSDAQMAAEAKFLQSKLAQLERGLEKAVHDCLIEMKESLAENIYERFDQVVAAAVNEANATAAKWGAPVNRENRAAGGYFWATYKAICRREGVYSNAQGLHDFNLQLTEPIIKQLGSHWEKAFARRLPNVLESFTRSTKSLLQSFHQDVQSRSMKTGAGIAGLAMLGQQLQNYEHIFKDLTTQIIQVINERQRDANREFTPVIARHLLSAYQYCTSESGPGSFMRMKDHMTAHVDIHRQTMFHQSTEEVKKHLTQMCQKVEEEMSNKADEVFLLMRRDYMTVITGAHMPQGQVMPKWERSARAEIAKIIQDKEDAASKDSAEEKVKSEMGMDETAQIKTERVHEEANVFSKDTSTSPSQPTNDAEKAIQDEPNKQIKEH